jgi:glycosyltransferase involved in cell wall biosynthesis
MPLEAELVREAMTRLARSGPRPFEFWLFGVKDDAAAAAYLSPLREAGARTRTFAYMPYADYLRTLSSVAVGLQPVAPGSPFSQGKSFGKVLGYLSADVAIVASDAVDHPLFFRDGVSGMLVRDAHAMAEATAALLDDPDRRARMADAAHEDFKSKLSTEAAAASVDRALRDAAGLR